MNSVVIHGEGLGKRYRRGVTADPGLRHALERFVKSPVAAFRREKQETFWALKDVSLEVKEGEVLGLIGRNGAGKTTLLKILSRITKPTTGWAEIHGRVGSLLEVGTGFHPELTGRENAFLSGAILGMPKSEITRKFDEIVAFAELEEETFWALKDVSLEVKEGEVLGLIGRNGAGKTTLLKILSRITKPTTGWAEIHGRVGSLLEVGTGFHPELTGRENAFLSGAILGMPKSEITRKFDEIVAFAELEKFIDTPVKHYSSGMYVRLAFAVAAHLEPEILLVDEVLAVGDINFQKKCLGKMGDVARAGRTVILVSHQINQIRRLCHRVIWVDDGHDSQGR